MKKKLGSIIHSSLHNDFSLETIVDILEIPKTRQFGDYSLPCFALASIYKKNPIQIARQLAETIKDEFITSATAAGPYVNFHLNREIISKECLKMKVPYQIPEKTKVLTIDFSSPNIAKPFSMGHLRSTVIGQAIANLGEKCGYNVIRINHIGDWGTQFGKLIAAYKRWGNEQAVMKHPIQELFRLYVKFHEEAAVLSELNEEGRSWFKRLEDGDAEAIELWKWFREASLEDFQRVYELLGVQFDTYNGEAFYNSQLSGISEMLEKKGLLEHSEGAKVVSLEKDNLPPCLIRKRDGATLYATRDLAAALYRKETYQFDKSLYVVGVEQSIHFKQVFAVLEKMGCSWHQDLHHIPFGFILKDGKKMSTRKGKVVLLDEVIRETISAAKANIEVKNPQLENKEEVARAVGVGAIIFQDLKNDRTNNIEFSLDEMLKFEGETGPYVQYTHARGCSLLRKSSGIKSENTMALTDDYGWEVQKLLFQYEEVIQSAFEKYDPSILAKYLLQVCRAFNSYYAKVKILEENQSLTSRLLLVQSVCSTLKDGLAILGIQALEKM
ncbi:arginine--tRNA ligase [Bacillus sp. HMSC76G11]|uniref:Arginine--tRNA ligase n=1 Tax=Metabacillus idriensis TaxID=324768 RepID=A0A6I2MEQ7_9BACI|nr:arginine--tRNA ligase [Metabacillus idriensis]MRX56249.1 arginine--tRNA ligase [Metabacillus idriensis]OHR69774.1 arginine--tRNA ligase [Bacillus sp. HMSC76G11]